MISDAPTIDGPAPPPPSGLIPGSGEAQPELDVQKLAERSREGCSASFEALVCHFEKRIFHFLYQMTRNQHDAEDLTQVTFLKAYRNLGRFHSGHAFSTWLFTIAKRTALNHLRDRRLCDELAPDLPAQTESPSAILEKEDEHENLWKLARSLTPDQHEALWLRYGQGFSISEVARVMKTNSLRVRVLLHRARAALANKLNRSQNHAGIGRRLRN